MSMQTGQILADRCTVVDRFSGPEECFAGGQPDIVRLHDGTLLCRYCGQPF